MNLEKYLESTNVFIRDVAEQLGEPDNPERAYRITRAVLTVMRERLTMQESFHLLSQLPFLLKAIYVDGWKPTAEPSRIRSVSQFVEEVRKADKRASERDLGSDEQSDRAVQAVFHVLKECISAGQASDIESSFPRDIRAFWNDA